MFIVIIIVIIIVTIIMIMIMIMIGYPSIHFQLGCGAPAKAEILLLVVLLVLLLLLLLQLFLNCELANNGQCVDIITPESLGVHNMQKLVRIELWAAQHSKSHSAELSIYNAFITDMLRM